MRKFNPSMIYNYLKENNISLSKFCKNCHMSKKTIDKLLNNNLRVSLNTIIKLCNFFKVRIDEFFTKE